MPEPLEGNLWLWLSYRCLVRSNYLRSPQRSGNGLHLDALARHVIARGADVAVVGAAHLNAILFDNVGAAALQDGVGRDDFDFVFVAFGEGSH